MTNKQNFHSIEGLRAYMAWWVVLGHAISVCGAPAWLPENISKRLASGTGVAVEVFIIVSGFVPLTSQASLQAAIGLSLVLLPLVSWALYQWVEKPFIMFGKKLSLSRLSANDSPVLPATQNRITETGAG